MHAWDGMQCARKGNAGCMWGLITCLGHSDNGQHKNLRLARDCVYICLCVYLHMAGAKETLAELVLQAVAAHEAGWLPVHVPVPVHVAAPVVIGDHMETDSQPDNSHVSEKELQAKAEKELKEQREKAEELKEFKEKAEKELKEKVRATLLQPQVGLGSCCFGAIFLIGCKLHLVWGSLQEGLLNRTL